MKGKRKSEASSFTSDAQRNNKHQHDSTPQNKCENNVHQQNRVKEDRQPYHKVVLSLLNDSHPVARLISGLCAEQMDITTGYRHTDQFRSQRRRKKVTYALPY